MAKVLMDPEEIENPQDPLTAKAIEIVDSVLVSNGIAVNYLDYTTIIWNAREFLRIHKNLDALGNEKLTSNDGGSIAA